MEVMLATETLGVTGGAETEASEQVQVWPVLLSGLFLGDLKSFLIWTDALSYEVLNHLCYDRKSC